MANPPEDSNDTDLDADARLQFRLRLLLKKLEAGEIKFATGLPIIASLQNVKIAPDGSVDLSTVDGHVRSLALAAEALTYRQQLKNSASLADIQHAYFGLIERNFGSFHKVMVQRGLTPHDAGLAVSTNPKAMAELLAHLEEFVEGVESFWRLARPAAIVHLQDLSGVMKGVFGGDLFPSATENIASKCSLYTETLILPDPFIRSRHIFRIMPPESKAYYLIKHALNILNYRELACCDAFPPIIVILPDEVEDVEKTSKWFVSRGQDDTLIHARHLFGKQFDSWDELIEYCNALDTIGKVTAAVSKPGRVLFDTEWKGSLDMQLERALKEPVLYEPGRCFPPGLTLGSSILWSDDYIKRASGEIP